jgi:nicotinate-nucleotide adenylyltransferase
MRLALFGGSFDPIHRGHVAIATAAADAFHLDTVLFAPAGRQPLKPGVSSAPFADRLAMAALACAPDPRFTPSSLDAPHPNGSPNYSVDTLATLHTLHPAATLYMLVGADSFLELRRWNQPDLLLTLAQWIVVSRPGFSLDDLSPLQLTPGQAAQVHLLESVHEDVSATLLRERLHHHDPCDDLLPPAVAAYIRSHHLY